MRIGGGRKRKRSPEGSRGTAPARRTTTEREENRKGERATREEIMNREDTRGGGSDTHMAGGDGGVRWYFTGGKSHPLFSPSLSSLLLCLFFTFFFIERGNNTYLLS